ncbi:MAG: hypothetical protein ACHQFX_13540 [Chitinophagales bacterium]
MNKTLTQITFEFAAMEEKEIMSADTAVMEEKVRETISPAIINKKTGSQRGRKSLKDINLASDLINIPDDEELFKNNTIQLARWQRCSGKINR